MKKMADEMMNSWEKGISCMGASGSPKEINPGIHFYWLLKNPPSYFKYLYFTYDMTHPFRPSRGRWTAIPAKHRKKPFPPSKTTWRLLSSAPAETISSRPSAMTRKAIHCEMSFAAGKKRELYVAPDNVNYSQLCDLFSRYAAGEELFPS